MVTKIDGNQQPIINPAALKAEKKDTAKNNANLPVQAQKPQENKDNVTISTEAKPPKPVEKKGFWGTLANVVSSGSDLLDSAIDAYTSIAKRVIDSFSTLSDDDKKDVKSANSDAVKELKTNSISAQASVEKAVNKNVEKGLLTTKEADAIKQMSPEKQLERLRMLNGLLRMAKDPKAATVAVDRMNVALKVVSAQAKSRPEFVAVVSEFKGLIKTKGHEFHAAATSVFSSKDVTAAQHKKASADTVETETFRLHAETALSENKVVITDQDKKDFASLAIEGQGVAKLAVDVAKAKGFEVNVEIASIASGKYLAAGAISGQTALAMTNNGTDHPTISLSSDQLIKLSTMPGDITETIVTMLIKNRVEQNDMDKKVQEANIQKNLGEKKADEKKQDKIDAEIKTLMQKLDNAKSVEERKFIKVHIDELKQKIT